MFLTVDQILPSLQSLGMFGYWLIGLAAALEAFFLTGVIVPGTLIVDAGGILVQRGLLDFFDLVWFVAIGSVLGSEVSFWVGRVALDRVPGKDKLSRSKAFVRAQNLFLRRGGLALVLGRFLGPVAGLVPLAAAMAGMDRRKFAIWNILGSFPYALAHVGFGFVVANVLGSLGNTFGRQAVLVAVCLLLLLVLWGILFSLVRLAPLALTFLSLVTRKVIEQPAVRQFLSKHPAAMDWLAKRLSRDTFTGLPLTILVTIFIYVGVVWLDSVLDFLHDSQIVQLDKRLAELIHHFQSPALINLSTWVTAAGSWTAVLPLTVAGLIWLLLQRCHTLAAGLLISVLGSTVSVALLKLIFQRPRSPLGFFLETSNSFPSGHAATSIGFYGMLMYVIWRAGKLRAETAILAAGLIAFLIGGSRIYLIEHYLSDVLNGWLVGILWVVFAVAVCEWLTSRKLGQNLPSVEGWRWKLGYGLIVLLGCVAGGNVWLYDHPRNAPLPSVTDQVLSSPKDLEKLSGLSEMTESLLGTPLRLASIVVLARDASALEHAFEGAGWKASPSPSLGRVFDAFTTVVDGQEDPTIETVPHFWRGQPNDLGFVEAASQRTKLADKGVHVRIWRTNYVTEAGLRAYLTTAGRDEDETPPLNCSTRSDAAAQDMVVKSLVQKGARIETSLAVKRSGAPCPSLQPAGRHVVVLSLS
ncbi:bifunctional DedA family/phosphatase PAP2 family protein [Roseibium aggregatum]|uniref:bifunctional DedA family/phosphatase PAP2 family protein n=1 Tax=Roseibium aggregatum TaxID=187304 RepID=UPI001E58A071|nr:bifunctional DedA family/phosphatase PAP2 family protein [Roseibium aggregatum]